MVALAFAAPLVYLAIGTLTDTEAAGHLLSRDALAPLLRTLTLAVSVSTAAAVLGTGAAWLVTRTDLPGRRIWRLLLPLPLVIPSFLGAFALIAALAPGGLVSSLLGVTALPQLRGLAGAFGVLTLLTYPYVYLPVAARLNQLPPSLEEAARLFGRRPREVFAEIVLPQIRSSILAGTLLVFLYAVSEFGAVQLLRYDTYTRLIYSALRSLELPLASALGLQLAVLALLVVLLERGVARAPTRVASRGIRGLHVPLGRWRAVATAGVATLVGTALVAPVAVLSFWAFRGLVRGSTRSSAVVTDLGRLLTPTWNTTRVSVAAAVLSIVVVLPIAYLTVRRRTVTGTVSNALVVAGFALPGLVVALSLVSWVIGSPVLSVAYQTIPLLVVAYVVHFGAQSLRAAEVAVASVPVRLEDAARALGAGRVRRFVTVELPLMLPGLLAGAGLVLLSTMKELPATLVLAPPGFETLATRVWNASQDVFLADASIAGLVLILLSGVLTWVLVVRRSDAL
ncbi:MAG: iron ABC transporter permease [Actinobacteria bacterium]|nr:iron ABC transporter permease [Actinomycetota bacterium]